jgi:hypothetical protein
MYSLVRCPNSFCIPSFAGAVNWPKGKSGISLGLKVTRLMVLVDVRVGGSFFLGLVGVGFLPMFDCARIGHHKEKESKQ